MALLFGVKVSLGDPAKIQFTVHITKIQSLCYRGKFSFNRQDSLF